MKYLKWITIVCMFFLVAGCAKGPTEVGIVGEKFEAVKRPDWVMKGSGAFPGDVGTIIYGVGVVNPMPNIALQRKAADSRAREAVAATMKTTVASLTKDFMEYNVDYFNIEDTAGSDEFISYIGKYTTDEVLVGSRIVERWQNPETGALYSLARVDMNDSMYDSYKKTIKRALSERHRAIVKERAEEALENLDSILEKQREREKEIIGIK